MTTSINRTDITTFSTNRTNIMVFIEESNLIMECMGQECIYDYDEAGLNRAIIHLSDLMERTTDPEKRFFYFSAMQGAQAHLGELV